MADHLYLAHHGIKGMKWGVRRFQNKDGSLTSAGEKRYGVSGSSIRSASTGRGPTNRRSQRQERTLVLSDKAKRNLKIGAAVAGTALAVYGAHRFGKWVNTQNFELNSRIGKQIGDNLTKNLMTNNMDPLEFANYPGAFKDDSARKWAAEMAGYSMRDAATRSLNMQMPKNPFTKVSRAFANRAVTKGRKTLTQVANIGTETLKAHRVSFDPFNDDYNRAEEYVDMAMRWGADVDWESFFLGLDTFK